MLRLKWIVIGTLFALAWVPTNAQNAPAGQAHKKVISGRVYDRSEPNPSTAPIKGALVRLSCGKGSSLVAYDTTNEDGKYALEYLPVLASDQNDTSAAACILDAIAPLYKKGVATGYKLKQVMNVLLDSAHSSDETYDLGLIPGGMAGGVIARAIAGYQQSGASSAKFEQGFFGDLTVNVPIGSFKHPKDCSQVPKSERASCLSKQWSRTERQSALGPDFRIFGSFRFTSAPQQINAGVGEFFADFSGQLTQVKLNELVASTEALFGVEQRFWASNHSYGNFLGSYRQRISVSGIAEAGFISPLDPNQTLQYFTVSPSLRKAYSVPAGVTTIGVVSADRDRFFRQYYAGIRFGLNYFDSAEFPIRSFPATFDISYGLNESVTRGRLRGGVFRFDGFYPLPIDQFNFIYFYGTWMIKPTRAKITDPIIANTVNVSADLVNSVPVYTSPAPDRDYYRVGVGIDLIRVISNFTENTKAAAKAVAGSS